MTITTDYSFDGDRTKHRFITPHTWLGVNIDDVRVCSISNWLFHSCSVMSLSNWNVDVFRQLTSKQVDELLEFLKHPYEKHARWSYNPTEYYFLESTRQRDMGFFKELCTRSCVKQIDKFINKSHPPGNPVYLWRISLSEDFK